jgi:excisionase family DNA binding protein
MRPRSLHVSLQADDGNLLTTGEAAKILGTSRQHIVDLCDAGDLPFVTVGTHRRVRRSDVEALRSRTQRLTRDQRRSLWLGHAIAGKLVHDPASVLRQAQENLENMHARSRGANRRWLEEWEQLLNGPIEDVLEALTSRSPRSRDLRQNSPFAGALSEQEREAVLSAFREADRGHRRR